jgi:transposase
MILRELPNKDIAETVGCSDRAVRRIRSRLRRYGTTTSPPNRVGRERKITPLMRDALFEKLAKQPDMFRDEMIRFLNDGFGVDVSPTTISRMLKTERWSRKTNGRVAKQRNPDLRELYLARVYPGSTDAATFEDFIDQLLHHCGKWPEPISVLVMDNASIHRSERLEQMCAEAGVGLLKLAPYSPDMNPIEELFAEIKTYIRQQRRNHADLFEKDFRTFLEMFVDVVGSRAESAEGHFRHSGISIEYPPELLLL